MRSHRQFFAFAVFLGVLTTPISAGAGRLTDFVLRFDFAAADSVERHSIPEAETAALSRALSGRDTAKIFHRERITDESQNFSLIYSREIAGAPIIIIADAPERDIVLEAPHPVKDRATGLQAVHLLIALGARAAIISGHNRCAAEPVALNRAADSEPATTNQRPTIRPPPSAVVPAQAGGAHRR
ncbi:MAG: hypothetical protein ACI9MJ_000983 [Alphaproteobacteria bacterium]|jgi:hypothetical protein